MKGVILCGGLGTRLYPLTRVTSKHLLPVYDKPMVYYPIETLKKAGIKDILCVLGGQFAEHYIPFLKDGSTLGVRLSYVYQDSLKGAGDAILLAEQFAHGEPIVVILGDQVTDADISDAVNSFQGGATLLLNEFSDPEGMGVPEFDPADPNIIISIEENPKLPKSKYAATGVYIYDGRCFDFIRKYAGKVGEIKPTDINNEYIALKELSWRLLEGYWADAGKFDRLFDATVYFESKARQNNVSN